MSEPSDHDLELDGVDPREADALREITDALRSDRHEPDDPYFWEALQRRIINEIAVTPQSQAPSLVAPPEARPGTLRKRFAALRRWLLGESTHRASAAGVTVAIALVLVLLVLTKDRPQQPIGRSPAPEGPLVMTPESAGRSGAVGGAERVIPEELWSEGFLANRPIEPDVSATAFADELGTSLSTNWELEGLESFSVQLATWEDDSETGWSTYPGFGANLNTLNDDELIILDELLDDG